MNKTQPTWIDSIFALSPCSDSHDWLRHVPDGTTPEAAWFACERGDWLLWLAARVVTDPAHRVSVVLAACDCAETALVHLPAGEDRPRKCIETVRAWARGEATIEDVRQGRSSAYAARDAADAAKAAYAASAAACAAYVDADAAADPYPYAADAAYVTCAADAAYATAYAAADAALDIDADACARAARAAHLKRLADIVRARCQFGVVFGALALWTRSTKPWPPVKGTEEQARRLEAAGWLFAPSGGWMAPTDDDKFDGRFWTPEDAIEALAAVRP